MEHRRIEREKLSGRCYQSTQVIEDANVYHSEYEGWPVLVNGVCEVLDSVALDLSTGFQAGMKTVK